MEILQQPQGSWKDFTGNVTGAQMTKDKLSKERRTLLYGLSTSWFKTSADWEQANLAYDFLDESTSAPQPHVVPHH